MPRNTVQKRQPAGLGMSSEVKGGSSRTLEEVAQMEGATPPSRESGVARATTAAKPAAPMKSGKGRGKGN